MQNGKLVKGNDAYDDGQVRQGTTKVLEKREDVELQMIVNGFALLHVVAILCSLNMPCTVCRRLLVYTDGRRPVMIQTTIKYGIAVIVLVTMSACATQERSERATNQSMQCRSDETLTCDEFAGETHNCSCEKGDNLRDMLDAYRKPDY